jgi:hypothetical protein
MDQLLAGIGCESVINITPYGQETIGMERKAVEDVMCADKHGQKPEA